MTYEEFKTVAHSLGVNHPCKKLPKEFYRNRYMVGSEQHHNFSTLISLESKGFMIRTENPDGIWFYVSNLGISEFRKHFSKNLQTGDLNF